MGSGDEPSASPLAMQRHAPWTREGNELLSQWMTEWSEREVAHENAAHTRQIFHRLIAIPTVVLPVVSMGLAAFMKTVDFGQDYAATAQLLGSVTTSILAGILTIVRADAASERHHAAAIRYADLIRDAQRLIVTEEPSRPEQVMTLQLLGDRASSLRDWEPTLPKEHGTGKVAAKRFWFGETAGRGIIEPLLSKDGMTFGRFLTS